MYEIVKKSLEYTVKIMFVFIIAIEYIIIIYRKYVVYYTGAMRFLFSRFFFDDFFRKKDDTIIYHIFDSNKNFDDYNSHQIKCTFLRNHFLSNYR